MIGLVCGGRDFDDIGFLIEFMDAQHALRGFTHIIHGAARGADTIADGWALSRGIQPVRCPALCGYYGSKSAGPMRNGAMAALRPNVVIAFPGGAGTASMLRIAKERGIEIIEAKRQKI